jgi:CRISPR-associated protein Cmr1
MHNIEATYRVVTPMFLGGSEPTKAEFRLPSFKGVLRFWWRALAWGRVRAQLREECNRPPERDQVLRRIKKQEDWLFGSTEGQAQFLLDAGADKPQRVEKGEVLENEDDTEMVGPGARYLGYGVMASFGRKAGKLSRECIRAPFDFTVRGLPKPKASKHSQKRFGVDLISTLRRALKAVGIFGGMGSKARKGYGSLVLQSFDDKSATTCPAALSNDIEQITRLAASPTQPENVPYTAFSSASRIYVGSASHGISPLQLLDRLGREMVRERSWGYEDKLFDSSEPAERNYKHDRDLMEYAKKGRHVEGHPDRVAFGLPHNYGKGYRQQVEPAHGDHNRRASPLFLKIHQFDDGRAGFVVTFLPAQFLPENEKLRVGECSVPLNKDGFWEPVKRYVRRITDTRNARMALTECHELRPQ